MKKKVFCETFRVILLFIQKSLNCKHGFRVNKKMLKFIVMTLFTEVEMSCTSQE